MILSSVMVYGMCVNYVYLCYGRSPHGIICTEPQLNLYVKHDNHGPDFTEQCYVPDLNGQEQTYPSAISQTNLGLRIPLCEIPVT